MDVANSNGHQCGGIHQVFAELAIDDSAVEMAGVKTA